MLEKIFETVKRYCKENQALVQTIAVGTLFFLVIGAGIFVSAMISDGRSLSGFLNLEKRGVPGDSKSAKLAAIMESIPSPEKICSFKSSDSPKRDLIILNEIAWMGNQENANNEWIELKNISLEAIDAGGWQIVSQNEKIKIALSSRVKIPPGGFYLLERGDIDFLTPVKADQFFTGAIKNSDNGLRLFAPDCSLADEAFAGSSWLAGDNKTKATMERDSKTFLWSDSSASGGTPKKENSLSPAGAARKSGEELYDESSERNEYENNEGGGGDDEPFYSQGGDNPNNINNSDSSDFNSEQGVENQTQAESLLTLCPLDSPRSLSRSVLINEVAWAGTASDKTAQEWIEVKNNSGSNMSLRGWQIQNGNQGVKIFFGDSDFIAPGGFYLLGRGNADFLQGIGFDKFFTGAIRNSDEVLRLFNENCNVVDEALTDVGNGKNWPAGTASPDYRTAERFPDLSWHTYSGSGVNKIMGTPRAENSPSLIPESPLLSPSPSPSPSPLNSPNPSPSPSPTPAPSPDPTPTPSPSPPQESESSSTQNEGCAEGQVNINAAPKEDLLQIKHIGSVRADELITLRPFVSVDDMTRINGIGPSRLADIKAQDLACVQ